MSEFETNMMIRFLQRNYPVIRIKDDKRFKRAIIFDNGATYFLSDEHSHIQLRLNLVQTLKTVFYCDEQSSRAVLKEFLNL
jgi:23S rRNA G2069 N7-methylase RlmK/C1962 C5-methylase RlmI